VVVRAIADSPLPVVAGIGHESDVSLAGLTADVRAATPSAAAELVSDRSEDLLLRVHGFRSDGSRWLAARIDSAGRRVEGLTPAKLSELAIHRVEEGWRDADHATQGLVRGATERLADARRRFEVAHRGLVDGSPMAVMERGYARVSRGDDSVLSAEELETGENVRIRWAHSRAEATITEVESGKL
jgi:exodeoxyribonuclease VII large subunit